MDIDIKTSHIYREANVHAAILSNVALEFDDFHCWSADFPAIGVAVMEDIIGKPKYFVLSFRATLYSKENNFLKYIT